MPAIGIGISPVIKRLYEESAYIFPPPPYLQAASLTSAVSTITGLGFTAGDTPTESDLFGIFADGLLLSSGSITIAPSANLQFWNGSTWQSTSLTISYSGGVFSTPYSGKVRFNPSVSAGTYNETLTISTTAINVSSWVINCSGVVAPSNYVNFTTDGTVTTSGDYKIIEMTSSGYLNISSISSDSAKNNIDIELSGGGGGGSLRGAGGAGGRKAFTYVATTGNKLIVIGSGGAAGVGTTSKATDGSSTSFDGTSTVGGGAGGVSKTSTANYYGNNGGSGGGGSVEPSGNISGIGGTATVGQGYAGGNSQAGASPYRGGGGGGASAVGVSGALTGNGGDGVLSAILGVYVNGGGGGGSNGGVAGVGGLGGGGNGSNNGTAGTDGAVNKGAGGGGGGTGNGGAGGKGYCFIKIKFQN